MRTIWSDDEKAKLRRMHAAGIRGKEMARALPGRTACACYDKVADLGLPPLDLDVSAHASIGMSTGQKAEIDRLRRLTGQSVAAFCRDALQRGMAEIAVEQRVILTIERKRPAVVMREARA